MVIMNAKFSALRARSLKVAMFIAAPLAALFANAAPANADWDLFNALEFRGNGQPTSLFGGNMAIIPRAINLMLFFVGILAVFMLIWGGMRYVLSGGDGGKVKDAKNTILYAIIGLVIAILGYAVVNWIIQILANGGGSGSTGGASV